MTFFIFSSGVATSAGESVVTTASQAFGSDIVYSVSDVPEQDRVHGSIPCSTAIECPWYREQLESDAEKELYDLIQAAILGLRERVAVPEDLTLSQVSWCFWSVIYDHPEYFWVQKVYTFYGDTSSDDGIITEFGLNYFTDDADVINAKWRDYELITDTVISGSYSKGAKGNVLRSIYDWLGHNTSYEGGERDQDMTSVFDEHKSVCAGYVQALQFMSLRAGIPCVRVPGRGVSPDGEEGNHTWAAIVLYREIGYYDITWDDSGYPTTMDHFYAMSQQEMEERHVFESEYPPRACLERDDSEEMITCSYYVETGEHLVVPDPDEIFGGDSFSTLFNHEFWDS